MTLTLDPPSLDPSGLTEPVDDGTRRELLIAGAVLALGLAGCGSDDGAGGGEQATRRVRHAAGVTEVPVRPSRVATLSEVVVAHLASVGLLVAGANDDGLNWVEPYRALLPEQLDPAAIRDLGLSDDPNVEALAELAPKVILSEEFSVELYPQLSRIAPTVLIARPSNAAWKEGFAQTVRVVGREPEATAVRERYEEVVGRVRGLRSDRRVSFVRTNDGGFRIDGTSAFAGSVAVEAGIAVADGPPGAEADPESGFVELSGERLAAIDGDIIVSAAYAGERPQVEELARNPLWKTLPAVRAGRVLTIAGEIYNGGTYVAAQLLLERLATELRR